MAKTVKYEIIFEGEYTEKERDLLWGKFFMELVKLNDKYGELKKCKTY